MSDLLSRLQERYRPLARLPLSLMIACLLCGLGIVQMVFFLGNGAYRYLYWQQQTAQATAQRNQLQDDVGVLQAVKDKANDPDYLRSLSRCLGFVGKNETLLVDQKAGAQSEDDGELPAGNCETVRLP